MLTVKSTINIAAQASPPIIPVVQGDTGRVIVFTLADFTIPTGATATYYVQKPSGLSVYNEATIDGNTVIVDLTAQSIIESGDNFGQIRIFNNDEVVTSFDFILLVKPFRGIGATQSDDEMNVFDKIVEEIDGTLNNIVAEVFDPENSYLAGEYVLKGVKFYKFTANHSGAWSDADVKETKIGDELTNGGGGGGGGAVNSVNGKTGTVVLDAGDLEYDGTETYSSGTVGAELSDLKEEISELDGLSNDVKQALLQIAEKVAYVDDDGADYYQDLYDALYPPTPPAELVSISAVYTQSGTVYDTDSLDSLKSDLVVTALYEDQTTETVTTYTLSGTLTAGTSTITASYEGKTATFTVTVTAAPILSSISAVYTQSGTVYSDDSLDSLKSDLVVTATYTDQTTEIITDYTLSGTLVAGTTSTITVSYGGKTTTFSVVVSDPVIIVVETEGNNKTLNESASVGTTYEGCKKTNSSRFRTVNPIAVSLGDVITFSAANINNDTLGAYLLWYDSEQKYTGQHSSSWDYSGSYIVDKSYPYLGICFRTQTNQVNIANGVLTVTAQGS